MKLIDALHWRYAVKRMNGKKLPETKLNAILDATRLSASSMGLQPYTILVVESDELKKRIHPVAYNQPQILESSHLLIFTAWENVSEKDVQDYLDNIVQTRGVTHESLEQFKGAMLNFINGRSQEEKYQWSARQAYIALGTALTAAAVEEVDATPMEGFDATAVDEILGLKEKGLRSVSILALGYRDAENDFLVNAPKVRRNKEELFLEVA